MYVRRGLEAYFTGNCGHFAKIRYRTTWHPLVAGFGRHQVAPEDQPASGEPGSGASGFGFVVAEAQGLTRYQLQQKLLG